MGPVWRELASEHFILSTDLNSRIGREALSQLETYRAGLIDAAYPRAPSRPMGQIPVIAVGAQEYWEHSKDYVGQFASNVLYTPMIAMAAGVRMSDQRTIVHELFHYVSAYYSPHQPKWLAEGLAQYFETVEFDSGSRELTTGWPAPGRLDAFWGHVRISIEKMVTEQANSDPPESFYPTSWMLTLYLLHSEPDRFADYQVLIKRGIPAIDAWKAVFREDETRGLDQKLRDYARRGEFVTRTWRFEPPAIHIRERILPDADAHARRALLWTTVDRKSKSVSEATKAALAEVDAGLASDPYHVQSLAIRALMLGQPVSSNAVMNTMKRHPDDWLAWTILAKLKKAQGQTVAAREAWARAVQLAKSNPAVSLPTEP